MDFKANVHILLYDIIIGPLRFSHSFSTKCICYNTNSSVLVQLRMESRWAPNTNRIIVTNIFSRDTVTKSQSNIDNIVG